MSRVAFSLALCLVGIALTIAAPHPEEQQQQQQQQQQNILQGISIPGGFPQVPNIPGLPGAGGSSAPTLDINTLASYNEYINQYISAIQNQTANIPIGTGSSGKHT